MFVKTMLASLLIVSATPAAFADSTTGVVVAYDRKAERVVLRDKTIWSLEGSDVVAPPDLAAGETVKIEYQSAGDDGVTKIQTITRVSQ